MSSSKENQNKIPALEADIAGLEAELKIVGISEAKEMVIQTRIAAIDSRIAAAEQRLAGLEARRERLEQQTSAGRNINVHDYLF